MVGISWIMRIRDMSDLVKEFPMVRPLRGQADWERLRDEAAKDGHEIFFPSHVIEKHGEVAGYLGVCSMPMLRMWLHTERMKARDSLLAMAVAENLMRANGVQAAGGLISRESNVFPHMAKMGWKGIGETVLHVKNLME
jgi:hypothetical protein